MILINEMNSAGGGTPNRMCLWQGSVSVALAHASEQIRHHYNYADPQSVNWTNMYGIYRKKLQRGGYAYHQTYHTAYH